MRRNKYQIYRIVFLFAFLGLVYYNFIGWPSSSSTSSGHRKHRPDLAKHDVEQLKQQAVDIFEDQQKEHDAFQNLQINNNLEPVVEHKSVEKQINDPYVEVNLPTIKAFLMARKLTGLWLDCKNL